jgi:hypothetical protein
VAALAMGMPHIQKLSFVNETRLRQGVMEGLLFGLTI